MTTIAAIYSDTPRLGIKVEEKVLVRVVRTYGLSREYISFKVISLNFRILFPLCSFMNCFAS
jgi:hypothetical protein